MSTLLLRLAAPIQSWGIDKFERRGTMRIPTKSAVIGMAMAAMGMKRDKPIPDWLSGLKFGVRVDDEGVVICDFHTVKTYKTKTDVECSLSQIDEDTFLYIEKLEEDNYYITNRFYLCDAVFVVGLEGEREHINKLHAAFCDPVFPLYLGRKSCPPQGRVVLKVSNLPLEQALSLKHTSWQIKPWRQEQKINQNMGRPITLRMSVDASDEDKGYFIKDMPVSFDFRHRKHGERKVKELPPQQIVSEPHDAYAAAKGAEL